MQRFTLIYYFETVTPEEAGEFFDGLIDAITGYANKKGKVCTGVSCIDTVSDEDIEREVDVLLEGQASTVL